MQTGRQEYSLEKIKVSHGRFFHFKVNDCSDKSTRIEPIPFGSISNLFGYHFFGSICQEKLIIAKRLRLKEFIIHVFKEPEGKKGFASELVDKVAIVRKENEYLLVVPPTSDQTIEKYELDPKRHYSRFYIDKNNLVRKSPEENYSGNIVIYGVVKEPISLKEWTQSERRTALNLLKDEEVEEVEAVEEVQILPAYSCIEKLRLNDLNKEVELEFYEIQNDIDRIEAYEIILRSHYLDIPKNGLILGCRFTDPNAQKLIFDRAKKEESKNHIDQWSEVWNEKPKKMVGCAVLSTLLHGLPVGRKEAAAKLGRDDVVKEWDKLNRSQIVAQLQIAWISRIAVDAPYRGFGLGSYLVKHLANVAGYHHVPKAKAVEVIRTVPEEEAEKLIEGRKTDFLIRGGYTLVKEPRYSQPLLSEDPNTGNRTVIKKAKKLYYYYLLDG